jgi:hypothetical protein
VRHEDNGELWIRVDVDLIEDAQETAEAQRIDVAALGNLCLRMQLRPETLPFAITAGVDPRTGDMADVETA